MIVLIPITLLISVAIATFSDPVPGKKTTVEHYQEGTADRVK